MKPIAATQNGQHYRRTNALYEGGVATTVSKVLALNRGMLQGLLQYTLFQLITERVMLVVRCLQTPGWSWGICSRRFIALVARKLLHHVMFTNGGNQLLGIWWGKRDLNFDLLPAGFAG